MATLKDVAGMASVSTSTASRILHGGNIRVSDATRQRVVQAAEDLKYRPNALARSLRTRVTRTVGFLIPDIQNPVCAQMIAGAEEAAQAQGYALMLMNSSSGEGRRTFIELLVQDRLDGLIIADSTIDDPWIDRLQSSGCTFLLVNRRTRANTPFVALDDQAGAGMGIQHLIDLGHKQIAYLAGPQGAESTEQRRQGVVLRCKETGIDLPEERIVSCGWGGEGVDAAIDRLVGKVTAIATGSIMIAFAAARSLQLRGARVPDDVSLIGYHDTPFATFVTPGITTVEMPLQELGRRAMMNILSRVNGVPVPNEVIGNPSPRLIVRQSTAALPA